MKKIILVLVVLAGVSGMAWSNVALASSVKVIDCGSIMKVIYEDEKPCSVNISIVNEQGTEIFTEIIHAKRGFIRPYNFTNLEEGDYWIVIEDESEKFIEQVQYDEPEKDELLAHVTKVKDEEFNNELYLLSVPDQEYRELTITVLDNRNDVLYQEKEKVSGDFAQLYKVKDQTGDIVINVRCSDGSSKTFRFPPTH